MPLKCPICGLTYESLGHLAQHVFLLADWYPRRERKGKGVGMRRLHYEWLEKERVTRTYKAVKRHLEGLLKRGLIKRA